MWADLDSDRDLDLFVGWNGIADGTSQVLDWSVYYVNDGDDGTGQFTFHDGTGPNPGNGDQIGYLGRIHAVDFADLNGDEKLDIVLARQNPTPGTLGNLIVCLNDGNGAMSIEGGPSFGVYATEPFQDVEITDLDGNGVPDVMAVPADQSEIRTFLGYGDGTNRVFWDTGTATGLGTGETFGIIAADFNADTDPDVFLLRPETGPNPADKRFLWANPLLTSPPPVGSEPMMTIGFETPPEGGPNASGLGTSVTVIVTTPAGETLSSTQVVDGGSGRGSQGAGRLSFGLGGASTAEVRIAWPHGAKEQFIDARAMPGFPNVTVGDTHDPVVDTSTITSTYTPSSGYTAHVFQWISEFDGGEPQVLLTASGRAPQPCKNVLGGGYQLLLERSMQGVGATSVYVEGDPSNGVDPYYVNTVTWSVYCEAPCTYSFAIRNLVGGQLYSYGGYTHVVGVCGEVSG